MDNKIKIGRILGGLSILAAVMSLIVYFITREPDTNIYFQVVFLTTISVLGIALAIASYLKGKRPVIFIIGFLSNGFLLVSAFLLFLTM